jgi:hypothetical protein
MDDVDVYEMLRCCLRPAQLVYITNYITKEM